MQETVNNGFITHENGISEAKKRHLLGPSAKIQKLSENTMTDS